MTRFIPAWGNSRCFVAVIVFLGGLAASNAAEAGNWAVYDTRFNVSPDYEYQVIVKKFENGQWTTITTQKYTYLGSDGYYYWWEIDAILSVPGNPTMVMGYVQNSYLGGEWVDVGTFECESSP